MGPTREEVLKAERMIQMTLTKCSWCRTDRMSSRFTGIS